jgi:hypothetical protein
MTTDLSHLDECIYELAELIESPEQLNYTLSKLVNICWLDSSGEFDALASLIGTLETVKAELYLRASRRAGSDSNGELFPD